MNACLNALFSLLTLLGLTLSCTPKRQFTNPSRLPLTLINTPNEPNSLLSDCPEQFGVQITAIRLTPQYTIFELLFTNHNQRVRNQYGQYVPQKGVWVNAETCLTSPKSPHQFKLLKAEGIPLSLSPRSPKLLKIPSFTQARFTLYFERLDPGLEWIDWGEPGNYRRNSFEFLDLHLANPPIAEPVLAGRPLTFTQRLKDSLLVDHPIPLKAVYFAPSQATLLANSYEAPTQLGHWLLQHPQCRIRLEGHTDIVGDHEQNRRLSHERAIACQQYLLRQGVSADRMEAVGYGDQRPLSRSQMEAERQGNRRVEVRLLAPQ